MSNVSTQPCPSWFAVWRWPRWVWYVLAVLMPVLYILALPPVFYLANHSRPKNNVFVQAAGLFWLPAILLSGHYESLDRLWDWEYQALYGAFGPPKSTGVLPPPSTPATIPP